jgi:hypothetical protein
MTEMTIHLSGALIVLVACALTLLGIIALTLLDIRARIARDDTEVRASARHATEDPTTARGDTGH